MFLRVLFLFYCFVSFSQVTFKSEGFQDWNKKTQLVLNEDYTFVFLSAETTCGYGGYRCTKIIGSYVMNNSKLVLKPISLLRINKKGERKSKLEYYFSEVNSENIYYTGSYKKVKNLVYNKRDLFVTKYDVVVYNNTVFLMNPKRYSSYFNQENFNLEEYSDYVGLSNAFNSVKDINANKDNYFKIILKTKLHSENINEFFDKESFVNSIPIEYRGKFHTENVDLNIIKTKSFFGKKYDDWDENDNKIIKGDEYIRLILDKGYKQNIHIGMVFRLQKNENECYDVITIYKVTKNKSFAILHDVNCSLINSKFVTQLF